MALAKFGNIIVDMRGSINGNTYSKNKAGAYVRTKVTPNNPQTTFQQQVRAQFQQITQAWRTLTDAQRDAWNATAPDWSRNNIFGDNVPLSGFGLYTKLNINLANIGATAIDEPPIQGEVTGSIVTELQFQDDGTAGFEYDPVPTVGNIDHIIFATAAYSPGKTNVNNRFRQIGILADGTVTTPFIITTMWANKFGSPPALGQKVSMRLLPISNISGQPGTPSMATCLVTPA